ncbi:MAG: murein biosynthesis integral membrane protein MurJ [Armatimonadetes bacterium]|nr:murein biosynthesis integral membrane protein MurJ [Armatimonadota bacterium]
MASAQASTARTPNVGRASGIMFLSLVLSRFLGIARDMVMAHQFGSNATTDAYRLAFQIPDLLFFLIAGGALSSAFIPVFSEYLHTEREREAWHIFSVVTSLMSLIILGFIGLAWVFSTPILQALAPGRMDSAELITRMSHIILPAQFAFFIGGLMFGTLYARQVFAVPGLGPNVYNLGIIFGAVVISHFVSPGVVGMSWGALIGAFIGNLIIPFYAMRKLGSHFSFTLDLKHPGVKKVFKLMLPVVLGLSLPGVYGVLMQRFGSLYQPGVNTWLDYGNKLMQAPLGIFGQSLAIAVFPALSEFYAKGSMHQFRLQLATTIRTVLYLTIPISVFMALEPHAIVGALYQSGKFKPEDTQVVAQMLSYFSIGICAWCLHPVLMRGFFAIHNSVSPIVQGTITTVIFFFLAKFLSSQTPLSYFGLPLASSLSAIILVVMLILSVRRAIGGLDIRGILLTLCKSAVASVVIVVICLGLNNSPVYDIALHHRIGMIAFVGFTFVMSTSAYYAVSRALGMKEAEYARKGANRGNLRAQAEPTVETDD